MDQLNDIAQQLIRFSPDALIVMDQRGFIRFANETVQDVLGYAPASLVGKPLAVLVPERLRARHQDHVAGFMASPHRREMGVRIADLAARRADGSEFPAGIRLAPFHLDGELFIAAAVRDTTERTRINEELVAAREEADRANRAKSRFLATASHDLRQPLQTVRLLNAAMLKIVPQPEVRALLQQQGQAIQSAARLLNALLDISRLESGAIEPHPVEVPLAAVFDELRTEFESVARARGLGLHFDTSAVVLSTDRILFYQLLQNLLGNAVKYTERGSIAVTCSPGSGGLEIGIDDTGIGIPADKLARIFDEYYQVDTSGAQRPGVGLGLAIVKEVARLLGFPVNISSRLGEGTQARVSIPQQFLVAAPAGSASARKPESPAAAMHRSRVILVEDHEGVRVATELFLKFEGYETLGAASAADAERLFAGLQRSDVIIADYHLDSRNTGLDMLLNLRRRVGYDVPGIVLSGDLPSVVRSIREPIPNCRFLGKPVDTAALLEAIRELGGTGSG